MWLLQNGTWYHNGMQDPINISSTVGYIGGASSQHLRQPLCHTVLLCPGPVRRVNYLPCQRWSQLGVTHPTCYLLCRLTAILTTAPT
jgi:hypothetical protein